MKKYLEMNNKNWLKLCKKKIKAEQQQIKIPENKQISFFENIKEGGQMKAELKTLKCDKECSLNAEGYCQSEMVIKGKSCDRRNNEGAVKITKIKPKKEDKPKSTLKVIDKTVTLKGEYGVHSETRRIECRRN